MIVLDRSDYMDSVIFIGDGRRVVGGGLEGEIRQWQADDGQELGQPGPMFAFRGVHVLCLAPTPDGSWFVSGREDGLVAVWDAATHSKVRQFNAHPDYPVEAIDVSPDGTRIATGSHDSTVCVWSFSASERLLGPLKHRYRLAAVKYSFDGRFIATATCARHSIRIYDSQDGRLLIDIPLKVDGFDQSIAWSNDSKYLYALSKGNIMCLDVSTGATALEWPIHGNDNPSGIILPQNGRFIAAATDTTHSFWDAITKKQIGPVIKNAGPLFSMDISRNYDLVTSGTRSVVIRSLRGVLPARYFDNRPCKRKIPQKETEDASLEDSVKMLLAEVRDLRARRDHSHKKIANLEDTVDELRQELTLSKCQAEREIESLEGKIEELRAELGESQHKRDAPSEDFEYDLVHGHSVHEFCI